MKTNKKRKPRQCLPKSKLSVIQQVCDLIPPHLISRLARKHDVDKKAQTFSPQSHVVAMLFAQLAAAMSLNDLWDNLRNHRSWLATIRSALCPSRNDLSNANRERSADMAEELFWETLRHFESQSPGFAHGPTRRKRGLPRRFKRTVHAVDSSTIKLIANNMNWAKHRRRKAAAKLHLRLNVGSFLPGFGIVEKAKHGENKRARQLCAHIQAGEIVVFDKAYVDYDHLNDLLEREVNWVTRAKSNMAFRVKRRLIKKPQGQILRDDIIVLTNAKSRSAWNHSFSRLCTMVRGVLWEKSALRELLVSYGTAGGHFRMLGRPDQVYLPGFT